MSPIPVDRLNAALTGRYHIERELGEGGMSTVFLAADLRHERKVALKVLKPELSAVVGAKRFLAEIKTTANLQHPHILPLFDSGQADGFLFYVMPYVEGESLRGRLDRERQLPVDEALRITTDVAEGLDYAHSRGVVHRDIKPANVLLQAGKAVISDFGIALAVGIAGGGRLTETGISLGTPYYMSPEQATGDQAVGGSTDIYALGCVLYEMLVGEPPYTGSTAQAILGRILQASHVPASDARHAVPANVDAAINRALERIPADRFATAQDFTRALADPAFRHQEEGSSARAVSGSPWNRLSVSFAVLTTALIGVSSWALMREEPPPPPTRFVLTLPDGAREGGWGLAVSPNGRVLVFADDAGRLYRRDLGQPDAVTIPGAADVWHPFFSPDGEWVGYFDRSGDELRKIRLDGAGGQVLALVPGEIRSAAWSPDGTIVFRSDQAAGLWRVADTGGEPEKIEGTDDDVLIRWISLTPDGRVALGGGINQAGEREVRALSLETGERKALVLGGTPRYASTGHIVFWREGGIWAVPFDHRRLEVTGDPVRIIDHVVARPDGLAEFAVGGDALFYREGIARDLVPLWVDQDGSVEVLDPSLSGIFGAPAISPDGQRIAFEYETPGVGTQDIWVYDVPQITFSRLTFEGDPNRYPFWSPDGSEVGFFSERDGTGALYARPWDLSRQTRLLVSDPEDHVLEGSWTPDGRWIVHRWGSDLTHGVQDIRYAAPGSDSAVALVNTPAVERNPALSPDGRWLAYTSDASGRPEVYVRPFPGPGGQSQISRGGGTNPVWSRDGREILYVSESPFELMSAVVRTEPGFSVQSRNPLFPYDASRLAYLASHPEWDVSLDGRRIMAIGSPRAGGRYVVIENLSTELRRLTSN